MIKPTSTSSTIKTEIAPEASKTSDVLKAYMSEMGTVPLLTKAEEITLTRQIHKAKQRLVANLAKTVFLYKNISLRENQIPEDSYAVLFDLYKDVDIITPEDSVNMLPTAKEIILNKLTANATELLQDSESIFSDYKNNKDFNTLLDKHQETTNQYIFEHILVINAFNELKKFNKLATKILQEMSDILSLNAELDKADVYSSLVIEGLTLSQTDILLSDVRGKKLSFELTELQTKLRLPAHELKKIYKRSSLAFMKWEGLKADMARANLRLVISIAKKYPLSYLPLSDMIQEGNIGLLKAVNKFEYRKCYKFSTYATWWIRQSITRSMADQSKTIRIPVHIVDILNKIDKAEQKYFLDNHKLPSSDYLAKSVGITEKKFNQIRCANSEILSVDDSISSDSEDITLKDVLPNVNAPDQVELLEKEQLGIILNNLVESLPEREKQIIRMRFGLNISRDYTLEEVGRKFGVTRERVRQIELKALGRISENSEKHDLYSFLQGLKK